MEKNANFPNVDECERAGPSGGRSPETTAETRSEALPLHRRRFDAKRAEFPRELDHLPSGAVENPRRFCESVAVGSRPPPLAHLYERSASTAAAVLVAEDAFDHLERLCRLMDQLLALKEKNSGLQRRARDLEHLKNLKEMHDVIEREMHRAKTADAGVPFGDCATRMDLDEEYECAEALLDGMLAAGRNASLKRAKWKGSSAPRYERFDGKRRSRSTGGEDPDSRPPSVADGSGRLLPPRRRSRRASDVKVAGDESKISKWTRVKAAFKWEKAHAGVALEADAAISLSAPLAVPPDTLSSASSVEELHETDCQMHENPRRSRSLDSSVMLDSISGQNPVEEEASSPSINKLHKTPWGKMKDIIQTRKESVRKKQNRNSVKSSGEVGNHSLSDGGCVSRSESSEVLRGSPRRKTSGQERSDAMSPPRDASRRTTPTLTVTVPSSEELAKCSRADFERPSEVEPQRIPLRKQKSLDASKRGRTVAPDSSDGDAASPAVRRRDSKWKKVKKAFLTSASVSTPSSPSRHSSFFAEYEGDEIADGDRPSEAADIAEEIRRDYAALRSRLGRELSDRASAHPGGRAGERTQISGGRGSSGPSTPGVVAAADDDRPPSEFRRKRLESDRVRGGVPVPTRDQLSEDFRKKLDEWKRLKATNSVPVYAGDEGERTPKDHDRDEKHAKAKKIGGPQKKEVLVQTGAGFFRFEGISRSFTRKLHEWEKSRGIAPEASTSALLRQSLARPPLPSIRIGHGAHPSGHQKGDRIGIRLQRSQSAGSVREESATNLLSASASSLSLTRLEEGQISDAEAGEDSFLSGDTAGKASSPAAPTDSESDGDGGPGALLVEVEDEVEETAAPLVACTPRVAPQTPVYRYGVAQERHRACENSEGKLSPIAHAAPIPPHPCTEKISGLRESVDILLREEEAVQKFLNGLCNINERCEDVLRQIEEFRGQPTRTITKVGELERRVGRLTKEKELLKNTLKTRLQNFNENASSFCKCAESFRKTCEDSPDYRSSIAKDFIEKVNTFNKRCLARFDPAGNRIVHSADLSEDLKTLLKSVDGLQSECNKCNLKRRDSNLCISYTLKRPKAKETNVPQNKENSIAVKAQAESNFKVTASASCDVSVTICNSNDDQQIRNDKKSGSCESDDDSKGAKKKTKDANDKNQTNGSKRKTKSRQRLEREKSIHSESDTEGDISTVTIEFPRRRKLLRTRRTSDTHVAYPRQNSFEKQSNTDSGDNVFVLKLKSNTQTDHSAADTDKDSPLPEKKTAISKKRSPDSSLSKSKASSLEKADSVEILISPEQIRIDIPPDGIEFQAESGENTTPDVFVKTTRKIFSPVRRDSKGKTKAVICVNLEDIASSIEKSKTEQYRGETEENLPDILACNERKNDPAHSSKDAVELASGSPKSDEQTRRQFSIVTSESLGNIRSHTPSPLFLRKQAQLNSSSRTLLGSRNASEESIYHSKDALPARRGSGERFAGACRGSPILSRSSTQSIPGISSALPPLPASPPSSRRDKPFSKETAPSIRIMIQKYNKKLNEEGGDSKPQGGANTPPWRSPRSQERFVHDVNRSIHHSSVRNNPFFDKEVQKSASASQITRQNNHRHQRNYAYSRENISDSSEMTPPLPKKLLRGILKSSSAGSLKTTSPLCRRKEYTSPDYRESEIPTTIREIPVDFDSRQKCEPDDEPPIPPPRGVGSRNCEAALRKNISSPRMIPESYGKKIDSDLLQLAKSRLNSERKETDSVYLSSDSSCSRAMKLKQAKEKFLASGSKSGGGNGENGSKKVCNSSSNVDLAGNRLSQISCGSDTSYEGNSLTIPAKATTGRDLDGTLLMKSASVGMIDAERDAFDRFNSEKGYESLPRDHSGLAEEAEEADRPHKSGSRFGLSSLASKFRKVRMRKGKQNQTKTPEKSGEKEKLDTVTRLCRQSLLVNLHGDRSERSRKNSCQTCGDGGSQTNMSIVSAGRTGGAVAVGSDRFFEAVDRGVCRSISMPDGSGCSRNT